MTREEARKFSYEWGNGDDTTVDEIYDDVDTRVCEHCEHWTMICQRPKDYHDEGVCSVMPLESTIAWRVAPDFGCIKFSRREDEYSNI